MTLIRYNNRFPGFFDDFMTKELDRWFEGRGNAANSRQSLPAVNVKETEEGYLLEVAAPGMKKEDFSVELEHDLLTISSEQEQKHEKNEETYTQREFSYQSFKRSFRLPKGKVDGDKVQARYENGILYLNLPKKEEAKPKPARQIEIA